MLFIASTLLAGCGASAEGHAATSTAASPAVATPSRTASIDLAATRRTAVAVESLASTAVARLEAKAAAQVHSAPSGPVHRPARTPTTIPSPTVTPVPATAVKAAPTRTASPTAQIFHRPVIQIAAIAACCAPPLTTRDEVRSPGFTAMGTWTLRWAGRCSHPRRGAASLLTVGVIPLGTRRPVDVFQTTISPAGVVKGKHPESVSGSYYLDVISPCETWLVEAVTAVVPSGAAPAYARTQQTALAVARASHAFITLAAARAQLAGSGTAIAPTTRHSAPRPPLHATQVARAGLEARRVANLRIVLTRLGAEARALKGAEGFLNRANSDFNPQSMTTVDATLNATTAELHRLQVMLAGQTQVAPFIRPVRRLAAATRRLQEVAAELATTVADLRAGNPTDVASTLTQAKVALKRAHNALKRAGVLLAAICASGC